MTLGWSVCCYLHGLPPDQLFKRGVVIRSEVSSQFTAGREKKKKRKDDKTLLFLLCLARRLHRFLSGGFMIGVCVCGSSITCKFD